MSLIIDHNLDRRNEPDYAARVERANSLTSTLCVYEGWLKASKEIIMSKGSTVIRMDEAVLYASAISLLRLWISELKVLDEDIEVTK